MNTMLATLPDDCTPNRLFMALFLRRLPANIRDQLVAQDLKVPAAMAAVADRIYDARPQGGNVHAAVHAVDRSLLPAAFRRPSGRRDNGHQDGGRRDKSRHRDEDSSNGLCFYHTNFCTRAARCLGNGSGANGLSSLIFLMEKDSCKSFLVDTGAAVSVVPFRGRPTAATAYLTGPDSTVIPAWGTVTLTLCFGGRQLLGSFVRAAVSKPTLGVDFLARHKLPVDSAGRCVLSADSLKPLSPPSIPCHCSAFTSSVGHITPQVRELLASFPAVIVNGTAWPQPRHGVEHVVETTGQPLHGGWTPTSSAPPKLKFVLWKQLASFAALIHHGRCLFTWFPRKMARGGHEATTGG
jgi:hypothetical protein